MRTKKNKMIDVLKNIIAFAISATMLTPILLVAITSVKTAAESTNMSFSWPTEFVFENYAVAIEKGGLVTAFCNSLLYSVVSVFFIVLLSSMTAYVFARNKTKLNKFFYTYLVLGLTLTVNHIALIKIMQGLHLLDTRLGIIILYIVLQLPFAVFLMYGFISSVPHEIEEAGLIDGCSPLRLFFSIVFPNLKPVIVSVGLLNFLNTWNEFTLPLYYLSDSSKWPMTNSIYLFYGQFSASWNLVSAAIMLTSVPVIIIYLLGQKHIVEGMSAGAVKG